MRHFAHIKDVITDSDSLLQLTSYTKCADVAMSFLCMQGPEDKLCEITAIITGSIGTISLAFAARNVLSQTGPRSNSRQQFWKSCLRFVLLNLGMTILLGVKCWGAQEMELMMPIFKIVDTVVCIIICEAVN